MNMRILVLSVVLGVLGMQVMAAAPSDPPPLSEKLKALHERAAALEDLTADFEQLRQTPLLREPLRSSGQVRMVGAVIRWDTVEPAPTVLWSDGTTLRMYDPEHQVLEIYPLDEHGGGFASAILPSLQTLESHFTLEQDEAREDVQADHLTLRLTPRTEELARYVQRVTVAVDAKHGYLHWMEIADPDEEVTELYLRGHRPDTGLVADDLALDIPPATRIVRPAGDDPRHEEGP